MEILVNYLGDRKRFLSNVEQIKKQKKYLFAIIKKKKYVELLFKLESKNYLVLSV